MIAFARFIVVAQHTFTIDDESQSVLEGMGTAWNSLRHMPNDNIRKGIFSNISSTADQFLRFHSVHDGHALVCCQLIQHTIVYIGSAVERLIEQRPDTAAQEAQLQAVARVIEQLEKQGVAVPDSLRETKMSLVAEIG